MDGSLAKATAFHGAVFSVDYVQARLAGLGGDDKWADGRGEWSFEVISYVTMGEWPVLTQGIKLDSVNLA
jgi:hypothetical protein